MVQSPVKRNRNFEVLRTIAMIMIVTWHFFIHGLDGMGFNDTAVSIFHFTVSQFLVTICSVCVNTYVLISGYFLITKEFKANRFFKIWFQTMFYNVLFAGIFFFAESAPVSVLANSFFPVKTEAYWFVNSYLGMVVVSPFLAKAATAMSKDTYDKLMIALCLVGTSFVFGYPLGNLLHFEGGHTFVWFICVFMAGGYLRRFDLPWNKYCSIKSFILLCLVICMMKVAGKVFHQSLYLTFPHYNSYPFFLSIILFSAFKKLILPDNFIIRFLQIVAPMTFGVYLIHDNNLVRFFMWSNVFEWISKTDSYAFLAIMVCVVLTVFLACVFIDYCRIKLFDALGINKRIEIAVNYFVTKVRCLISKK